VKDLTTKLPAKTRKKIDAAISLYENFSGHKPEIIDRVRLRVDTVAIAIGHLDAVMYSTVRDGKKERYIHKFRKGSRPVLACSSDGKQLYILTGGYRFTDRGIVD
jgi:hypothetical protein